ncbi:MAG: glycosyltransferase family 39 protein [Candidatus Omnitrophica bacterium]|nr:glycosyltransferase family 39 protein [Candidatus Omnitrophota bacterium]
MLKKIDNSEKYIWIFAITVVIAAWCFSFLNGYVLTYNDAASHLNIARRVIDNLTPGFAQIGTVWLPLPHLLMLIFAWNDFMWHTALAGSIVSMASYVITVVFIYKLILLLTENKPAAAIGAVILGLNPNFLYLATTPMTEPVLIASFTLSAYFIAKYIKTKEILSLILGGVFIMTSTLTRYDGWFLFAFLTVLLLIWSWVALGWKKAEGIILLFMSIGGFGILLWLLWNLTIFGDALYFIHGPYSAYVQQKALRSVGQLPTEGNLFLSFSYYIWSIIENNGFIIALLSLFGLIVAPFLLKSKQQLVVLLAVLSPFVFNVLALFLGQSAMNVPQAVKDPGLFNIRYGILMLPAFALALGILASRKKLFLIVLLVFIIQSFLFFRQGLPVALVDGLKGLENTHYTVEASKWLADNYQGGLILTSLASHDAFVARAQLPMKFYIHEGTREYWQNALKKPSVSVKYIAAMSYPPDLVYRALKDEPDFINNYVLVHSYGTFGIYQRR